MTLLQQSARVFIPGLLLGVCVACSGEQPVSPNAPISELRLSKDKGDDKVELCHKPNGPANVIEVSMNAMGAHIGHGDYVARYIVESGNPNNGDGVHMARITDALAAAKVSRIALHEYAVASCPISIEVAAQTFTGTFDVVDASKEKLPLVVDVPGIEIKGSFVMGFDPAGRANGVSANGSTVLIPDRALVANEGLIVVADNTNGHEPSSVYYGNNATIRGIDFQSNNATAIGQGTGVIGQRVHAINVQGNRFDPRFTSAVDLRASDGDVNENYGANFATTCGICLSGPGNYAVKRNRLDNVGLVGVLVTAVTPDIPILLGQQTSYIVKYLIPNAPATVTSTVEDNDIRNMLAKTTTGVPKPIGSGVRVLDQAQLAGAGELSPKDVAKTNIATISKNTFTNNVFAIIVDAGFTVAINTQHDVVDVTTKDNVFAGSCENNLLVAFTRHTGALGINVQQYLVNTTYRLTLGDLDWATAWYANPTSLGLPNVLTVNGAPKMSGIFAPYVAANCP